MVEDRGFIYKKKDKQSTLMTKLMLMQLSLDWSESLKIFGRFWDCEW